MKVVITGGHGEVAHWLVLELTKRRRGESRYEVTTFDISPATMRPGVRSVVGNHESLEDLKRAFTGADAVLHLSASTPSNGGKVTIDSNVRGTQNVFEAARLTGVRRVVYWGSVSAYGWSQPDNNFIPDYLPLDENHPLLADDPYGKSKAEGEVIAQMYADVHGMEVITLRHGWAITPEILLGLWAKNGRTHPTYVHQSYVDLRDIARAGRLALEIELTEYTVVTAVADDSSCAEPLCDLLPRLNPAIGDRAKTLTGTLPAISNAKAKVVLGWQPEWSWRKPPLIDRTSWLLKHRAKRWLKRLARRVAKRIKRLKQN